MNITAPTVWKIFFDDLDSISVQIDCFLGLKCVRTMLFKQKIGIINLIIIFADVFYLKLILFSYSELQNKHFSSGNALNNVCEAFSPRNPLKPLLLALRSCFFKSYHLKSLSLSLGDFFAQNRSF